MSTLSEPLQGKAWKFGDSISTNQIGGGGGRAMRNTPAEERRAAMKANCLRAARPEFPENVKDGDILVAGSNFGNGSSSPGAVEALQACGLQALVAESISRLLLRTCVAKGLPAFNAPGITEIIEDGEELRVDYVGGTISNPKTGKQVVLKKLPPTVEQIYEAGGIQQVIGQRLAAEGVLPPTPIVADLRA
jgi:3-isopropylmalate/(R)-2-methylmalate dehydratase small subunit